MKAIRILIGIPMLFVWAILYLLSLFVAYILYFLDKEIYDLVEKFYDFGNDSSFLDKINKQNLN